MTLVYERLRDVAKVNDRILDIGTKTGRNLDGVSGRIVAVDILVEPTLNIEYVLADGRSLPFADDAFDYVTSNQVLEHVADKARLLDEVKRVLKPNGTFILSFPNRVFPIDPHNLPLFSPWLPKRIVMFYLRLIGDDDRHEYVQNQCFYLTSFRGRKMLNRRFGTVTYRTLDYSVKYPQIFQSNLGRKYRSLLPLIKSVVTNIPFTEKLYEYLFGHACYECTLD